MKFSDRSETNQAGYEEASNTRMSSWLINESCTPRAGPEPGSGSGTLEGEFAQAESEGCAERSELARRSHASVNAPHTGEISRGKNKRTLRFVDLAKAGSHEDVRFC